LSVSSEIITGPLINFQSPLKLTQVRIRRAGIGFSWLPKIAILFRMVFLNFFLVKRSSVSIAFAHALKCSTVSYEGFSAKLPFYGD
jgi:hypothetical protein